MSRGADVTLVTGPTACEPPRFVNVVPVVTAAQMYDAVMSRAKEQDIIVKAAAVADYRPASVAEEKIKKSDREASIELERTQDILAALGADKGKTILCGFSMETEHMLENSRKKLRKKNVDLIAANNLKVEGAGFGTDTNVVTIITRERNLELEKIGNSISNLNSQIAALTTEKKNAPAGEQLSYTTQIQELQTNVKQEEYNYKVKELEVNRTKKSLESSTVTSTIAGIIQEINPDPSYDNYSGEKQAFMSILSTGKYRIKGKISEQNIGELQPGMAVTVRARNNQEEIWKGSVDVIDTEKPESSSQSEMYSGSDSSARATKYPFYVTLETSDGLMLGQHVYIEPGNGVNTEGLHLMTAYIVDTDGKEPYVWVANEKDRLEKRKVKLGAYDEEQDTWEITEGLKETDYIVWPDGECKEGAAVQKNENVQAGGMEEGE